MRKVVDGMKLKIRIKGKVKGFRFYFLILGIWLFFSMLIHSGYKDIIPQHVFSGVNLLIICCSLFRFLMEKTSRYSLIVSAILVALGIVTFFTSGQSSFIVLVIVLVGSKNLKFRFIVKVILISLGSCMLFVVLSCKAGIIPNLIFYRYGVERHSLGFAYVYLSSYFLNWALLYLYFRDKKTTIKEYIALFAVGYLLYKGSNVRGTYILLCFTLVFHLLFVRKSQFDINHRSQRILALCIYPLCAISSIVISIIYNPDNSYFSMLNILSTGRLVFMKKAFDKYGMNLFGNNVSFVGNQYGVERISQYVDNSYLQFGIQYGIIVITLLVVIYTFVTYLSVKNNELMLFYWLLLIAVDSMIYPNLISVIHNSVVMILSVFFANKPKKIMERDKLLNDE